MRLDKGFSQEFMAEVMEISQSQYSRLESGETIFDVEKLGKVIEILQANPADIIDFEEPNTMIVNSSNTNNHNWVINSTVNESPEIVLDQIKVLFKELVQLVKNED